MTELSKGYLSDVPFPGHQRLPTHMHLEGFLGPMVLFPQWEAPLKQVVLGGELDF